MRRQELQISNSLVFDLTLGAHGPQHDTARPRQRRAVERILSSVVYTLRHRRGSL